MSPPSTTLVRAARPEDLDALVALLAQLFALEPDFSIDTQRQRRGLALLLAEPRARVLLAERDGRPIGMVTGQLVVSTSEGAPSAWVEDLVVDAGARGTGVGAVLLAELEAWARGAGATRLQLLADRENAPALAFYGRSGWAPTRLVCWRRRETP